VFVVTSFTFAQKYLLENRCWSDIRLSAKSVKMKIAQLFPQWICHENMFTLPSNLDTWTNEQKEFVYTNMETILWLLIEVLC